MANIFFSDDVSPFEGRSFDLSRLYLCYVLGKDSPYSRFNSYLLR
jgi:hypothetical protein